MPESRGFLSLIADIVEAEDRLRDKYSTFSLLAPGISSVISEFLEPVSTLEPERTVAAGIKVRGEDAGQQVTKIWILSAVGEAYVDCLLRPSTEASSQLFASDTNSSILAK